ncbi:RecX family transcriptional regulator [Olsenella sp. An293]|uniref:regulatory protein RecX n=1 Tax=Olsenella sp. An293 TaxID=1965626 RepID=UPI000B38D0D0|nr:RecX family transcriptional regulator [Olsenella sp. An293]OUO32178.1 hypothetical protein B5F85_07635 [Olsenella sp. An293]
MPGSLGSLEVRLPERGSRSRRARVTLRTPGLGEEALEVPVAVGRRLSAKGAPEPSTREELLEAVGALGRSCARARVADLLGRRDYTSSELMDKLRADGYADDLVCETLSWARDCGLVDDARYGAAFARSKALAGWGRVKVERELERRGVRVDEVEGWPEEFFDDDSERSRALELASRRRLTGKNDYEKIMRFLCGRGFPYGVSAEVAREVAGRSARSLT